LMLSCMCWVAAVPGALGLTIFQPGIPPITTFGNGNGKGSGIRSLPLSG